MTTFWLSFAPETGPGRVILVDAATKTRAHLKALALGMSREGDEVLILEIPPDAPEHALPRDRELTEAEIRECGALPIDEAREQGLRPVWEAE